jgi:hypothetical protein
MCFVIKNVTERVMLLLFKKLKVVSMALVSCFLLLLLLVALVLVL